MPISHLPPPIVLAAPLLTLSQGPFAGWLTDELAIAMVHWPEDDRGHAKSRPCEGDDCLLCRTSEAKPHYLVPALRELGPAVGPEPASRVHVREVNWSQTAQARAQSLSQSNADGPRPRRPRQAVVLDLPEGCIIALFRALGQCPWRGVCCTLSRSTGRDARSHVKVIDTTMPDDLAEPICLRSYCAAKWRYPLERVTIEPDEHARKVLRFARRQTGQTEG